MNATPAATAFDPRPVAPSVVNGLSMTSIRRRGLMLTAGAVVWASTIFTFGPTADGVGGRLGDLAGAAFQLGLFALLSVMLASGATGVSRAARVMVRVEYVLLGLATTWSVLHGVLPESMQDAPWLVALDAFWPLSMLGMFVIGVKVALAGRWRGLLRWWPLVAESWVFVTLPAMAVLGETGGAVVGGLHLIVGYATLGVLLANRPELTMAR